MAKQDVDMIIKEIHAHIQKQGGEPSDWYVGITENIEERLFGTHKVPKKNHWFIYREAYSDKDARQVEKAFLDWGCDGGEGGGDEDATFIYAYLKTPVTKP